MNERLNVRACAGLSALVLLLASCPSGALKPDAAAKEIAKLARGVKPIETASRAAALAPSDSGGSLADQLPPIEKYPLTVDPGDQGSGAVVAEIFSSPEKAGTGLDGWLAETAQSFNESGARLASGEAALVAIRKMDSGLGAQYIASRAYLPDGFSPSSELWLRMVEASGVSADVVSPRLVGNVPGIVMKKAVKDSLEKAYGRADFKAVVDATAKKSLFMGYTNPFASTTGLNFLQTVLLSFAGGNESKALGPEAESAFEAFQAGVPFVSLTTIQMRESVERNGSLDAFVLERQSFENLASRDQYVFLPFGLRHDNPLAAIGGASTQKREALALFARYCASSERQAAATKDGFNRLEEYASPYPAPSGAFLKSAQSLWKEKKDSGRPVVAVFLSDVSGSMDGDPLINLKKALLAGSKFISPSNYIGLASFSAKVRSLLPVRRFDARQKAEFDAAAGALEVEGKTAMYDGIVVAEDMILKAAASIPGAKMMVFVLTDGETNLGLSYARVKPALAGTGIPIYTIKYGDADVSVLSELSALNEAAALKSDEKDVAYQLGSLLNAEM